jgi:hypothetical protein
MSMPMHHRSRIRRQVGDCLRYTGRDGNLLGEAAFDPRPRSSCAQRRDRLQPQCIPQRVLSS